MLHCHEIWTYDGSEYSCECGYQQGLEKVVPLCQNCHAVKHIWQSPSGIEDGEVVNQQQAQSQQKALAHFLAVNACDERVFEKHLKDAQEEYNRLSAVDKSQWTIHYGDYDDIYRQSKYNKNEYYPAKLLTDTSGLLYDEVSEFELSNEDIFRYRIASVAFKNLPTDLRQHLGGKHVVAKKYYYWAEHRSFRAGFLVSEETEIRCATASIYRPWPMIPVEEPCLRWSAFGVDHDTGLTCYTEDVGIFGECQTTEDVLEAFMIGQWWSGPDSFH